MDSSDYVNALARDGKALADAAVTAPDAEVAACPGWDMNDLLWHITDVHLFWEAIAGQRLQDPKQAPKPDRPGDEVLLSMYREGLDRLVRTLVDTDPATDVWTWSSAKNVGFIGRRMAQETAVHRWDAEHAAGRDHAIEPRLAADGIDEFFTFMLADVADDAEPIGGSVHFHCTDTDGEWIIRPEGDDLVVTPEHAKGDAAVRGTASDLLLIVWRRLPLEAAEVIGDRSVAERLVAHTDLD